MNSPFAGAILETGVYGQLLRSFNHHGKRPQLYFFRDAKGTAEVDFLLIQNGKIYPMEVKRNSNPSLADLKAVNRIPTGTAIMQPGIVLCTAREMLGLGKGNYAFPISAM